VGVTFTCVLCVSWVCLLLLDMESGFGDTEIGVKITPNILETSMLVKMTSGHRSQNFIDEVFRAAQSKLRHPFREFIIRNNYWDMFALDYILRHEFGLRVTNVNKQFRPL
jgi:hypothetical protein